jgi:hypothetical protein
LHQSENVYIETAPTEEVVDFEDWMVSEKQPTGISFTLVDNDWNRDNIILQAHPEILEMEGENIDSDIKKLLETPPEDQADSNRAATSQRRDPVEAEDMEISGCAPQAEDLFGSDSDSEDSDD